MNANDSPKEWYLSSPYANYVLDRRLVASTPAVMLDIRQPAGDFPDAPVDELVICQDRSGTRATCDFGAGRFNFLRGSIAVVPSQSATQITVENPHHIRCLGFSADRLSAWIDGEPRQTDLGHLHRSVLNSPFIHQLMDRIWDFGEIDAGSSALMGDAALLMLWAELLREARMPVKLPAKGGLAPWQVRRCTEFLNEHAHESIGLEQLAALVGLSPFHFARAFKQSTGVPPHRYQLNLRIQRAKALLELTELPVTEIAFDVGYESTQALSRLFRREVGVSPSDYRRAHRV
jgi:AraC family transcriptional regulator